MQVTMGVLLSAGRYQKLLAGHWNGWRLRALAEERNLGVRTVVAHPAALSGGLNEGYAAVPTARGWHEELVRGLPRVYHNRIVLPDPAQARALRQLNGDQHTVVFNETNRWRRQMVYEMLRALPETRDLVPPTQPYAGPPREPGLYLLATSRRAVRDRCMLLQRDRRGVCWQLDPRGGLGKPLSLPAEATPAPFSPGSDWKTVLISRLDRPPVGPQGHVVEWRFYLHREDQAGAWTLAGAVAKEDIVWEPGRPALTWRVREALLLTFGRETSSSLEDTLSSSALAVARNLSLFLPGIAHLATDFWVNREGLPILIDLTGHYRTHWLERVGDYSSLNRVLEHPARFARLVTRMGVAKLDVDFGRSRNAKWS